MRLLPKDSNLGWTPYAWLVYHGMFYVHPIVDRVSALEWTLTILATAVFLPTYFAGYWLKGKRVLIPVAIMTLLGMVFSPFNLGASGFFIYAAAALGAVGRPGIAVRYLAGLIAIILVETWVMDLDPTVWVVAVLFSLLVGGVNIHFAEVHRSQARLRLAQTEVERLATLAERERIARDLHDLLGHTLSMITLKSELAGKLVARDPESAKREMREIETVSRKALAEVRTAVEGYRFARLGVELSRAKVALGTAGVELDIAAGPFDLSAELENVVALAVREAVTNVLRHSKAEACRIEYGQGEGVFRLRVSDSGRGGRMAEGSGLAGMRERVEGLGGTARFDGANGASVEIEIPSRPARDRQPSVAETATG